MVMITVAQSAGEHGGKVYADTCIFKDNKANENGRAISVAGEQFTNLEKSTNKRMITSRPLDNQFNYC